MWRSNGSQLSSHDADEGRCGSPGPHLIKFYSKFNWKWKQTGPGPSRTESHFFLFTLQLNMEQKLVWGSQDRSLGIAPGPNVIGFYSNFNWKWKEVGPVHAQDRIWLIAIQISIEHEENLVPCSQDRICLISIQISSENARTLVQGSPGSNLTLESYRKYSSGREVRFNALWYNA